MVNQYQCPVGRRKEARVGKHYKEMTSAENGPSPCDNWEEILIVSCKQQTQPATTTTASRLWNWCKALRYGTHGKQTPHDTFIYTMHQLE